MDVPTLVSLFLEHVWVPSLAALAWAGRILLRKNEEFMTFKLQTEGRLQVLENQSISTEAMRQLIQSVLLPHIQAVSDIEEKLDEINEQVTKIRIRVGE